MKKPFPYVSVAISLITLVVSAGLAYYLNGKPWSTVTINQLRIYGGIDTQQFLAGEIWRVVTAQLVHVKQFHMVFNVVSLLLLGISIEPLVGKTKTLLLWLLAGGLGTIASVFLSSYSEDVGSGASQAVMGFLGASIFVIYRRLTQPKWLLAVVLTISLVTLFLDLYFAHYPKPGHVVGFIVGVILGYFFIPKKSDGVLSVA